MTAQATRLSGREEGDVEWNCRTVLFQLQADPNVVVQSTFTP
jgi:hypothetical protein